MNDQIISGFKKLAKFYPHIKDQANEMIDEYKTEMERTTNQNQVIRSYRSKLENLFEQIQNSGEDNG